MKDKITKELKDLFDDLEMNAYNKDYHTYYYKDANQIVRKHFERLQQQVSIEPEVKPACEHNYQIANKNYYKPTGRIGALGVMTYKQDVSYSMLFCTKCGETKEIVTS